MSQERTTPIDSIGPIEPRGLDRRTFVACTAAACATACGGGGGGGGTPPAALPAIQSFTASPSPIKAGQSSTLAWSVSGATRLSIDAPGGADVLALASLPVSPAQTTVYTLTATNGAGTVSRTVTVEVQQAPEFTLSPSASTLSMAPGGTASLSVGIPRTGGFASEVALSLAGAPAGLDASFSPNPAPGASATLNLAAGASAATGSYVLTVQGSGGGITRTATFTLALSTAADFSLGLGTAEVTLLPGGSLQLPLTLTRGPGFSEAVALSLQGAPAGLSGTFLPNPAPGGSASFTLGAAASLASGVYAVTVQGTGGGKTHAVALSVRVEDAPGFALSAAPPALTVVQGASATATLTATRQGGFADPILLSLDGAPDGLTGTFSPNPLAGSQATLTLLAAASVAPGVYALRIAGSSGSLRRETPLSATVALAPGFGLSLGAAALNLAQGGSGNVQVNLQRSGGFAGDVAFSLTGAPAGVHAGFAPPSTPGDASTLTLSVDPGQATGTFDLTVQGQSGSLVHSASLTLQVSASLTLITTNDTQASFTSNTCRGYLAGNQRFYLCKDGGGIYALTSVCTHLGCDVGFQAPPPNPITFKCPCHGSEYDENGFNTLGPAALPLVHYRVFEPTPGAKLVVDKGMTVPAATRLT